MNKIVKRFENMMLSSLLMSVMDIAIGLLFILYTDFSSKINMIIIGSLILIHGLVYLIRYIYDGLGNKFFSIELVWGVAAIILGLFTIFNPFDALKTMGILFGIWIFISGLDKLYYGVIFIKYQEEISPLVTFISIVLIVMGILTILNPFSAFILITRLVGLFMICGGILDILTCMLYRKRAKALLEIFK